MIDNAEGKKSTLVLDLLYLPWIMDILGSAYIREAFKYSLADFVRREGGGAPPHPPKVFSPKYCPQRGGGWYKTDHGDEEDFNQYCKTVTYVFVLVIVFLCLNSNAMSISFNKCMRMVGKCGGTPKSANF